MTRPLGVLGLALMMGAPAYAAKKAEVAVVGLHVAGTDDAQAVAASEQLTAALDKSGSLEVVEPGEVRARLAGREELVIEGTFLGPGRQMLEEGRVLYDRADFESAIPVLEDSVDALRAGLPGAKDSKDLIEALLLLGLAQAGIGELDAARGAYKQVVVLDQNRRLDPVRYAPKIVALFDEVREQVLSLPRAAIVVQAPDGEHEVFIDGRSVGNAPTTVKDLPSGTHYLLVVGSKGEREFARIDLSPGAKQTYLATLAGRSLGEPGKDKAAREHQTRLLYESLGEYIATPLVLLGGELGDGRVAVQLYEPRTETFSRAVVGDGGGDPVGAMVDLTPTLAAYVTEDGTLRSDRTSPDVASLDLSTNALLASMLLDPEPIVKEVNVGGGGAPWYLWAGVAAVAGGGAAAAVLLTQDSGGTDDPVDPNQGTVLVGPFP